LEKWGVGEFECLCGKNNTFKHKGIKAYVEHKNEHGTQKSETRNQKSETRTNVNKLTPIIFIILTV
jgi:hypothetical protein